MTVILKKLVLQFSNDNLSFRNGGELPEFGVGRYDPMFESTAFALESDGAISNPVRTAFGFHIIKRLAHIATPKNKSDSQWRAVIKQQIMQNDRMEVSRKNQSITYNKKQDSKSYHSIKIIYGD